MTKKFEMKGSKLEFILILFALGAAGLVFMQWVWPSLLAATILMYSVGALVVFVAIALYAIFWRPCR